MSSEDKYDTLEKIGHGSFGIIRKVRRKTDGFVMCRKEISYLRMSQKEREQLHAEFQILSHLRHANIVAYYHREHLKVSQDLHLYMEYCGNGDLGRVIKDLQVKSEWAQESFVWSIFSQLVMALYRCHYGIDPPEVGANMLGLTKGNATAGPKVPAGTMTILHRDLKPENVFLGEDNSVKLGDFGLSKMIKSHDFASTYVGTPFYMSPEICAAEKYTLKSDIWSLGCIMYELCSREPPFNAKTHFQLVQKIKEGRVPALPDMYSSDLNQVIRDCLKVNPDRRPDTAALLNLPVVKLMRKEKEVVDLNRSLRVRDEALRRREKDMADGLANLDRERHLMREDMDSSLRREWEVKARLEIDRLVNDEMERLHQRFDDEVRARVDAELSKKTVSFAPPPPPHLEDRPPVDDDHGSSVAKSDYPHSSIGASGDEAASNTTDMTEYSLDSPDTSREMKKPGGQSRTPFGRAQTMFAGNTAGGGAGTPMDVDMASPSPMAIASLSLSPRRTGATKAPSSHTGNIFAAANAGADPRWEVPREPALVDSDEDEDADGADEDVAPASPTRQIRSSKNPFTSKSRPVLTSQKSCPASRLRPQGSGSGLASKAGAAAAASSQQQQQPESAPASRGPSPSRRLSKIPSAANLQSEGAGSGGSGSNSNGNGNNSSGSGSGSGGLSRKPSPLSPPKKDGSGSGSGSGSGNGGGGEALGKVAAKNNIKGRTLVELQQARAGGRPLSAIGGAENVSPKRAAFRDRVAGGAEPVAVWDPERDEMPSPFLRRQRKMARV